MNNELSFLLINGENKIYLGNSYKDNEIRSIKFSIIEDSLNTNKVYLKISYIDEEIKYYSRVVVLNSIKEFLLEKLNIKGVLIIEPLILFPDGISIPLKSIDLKNIDRDGIISIYIDSDGNTIIDCSDIEV